MAEQTMYGQAPFCRTPPLPAAVLELQGLRLGLVVLLGQPVFIEEVPKPLAGMIAFSARSACPAASRE